MKALLVMGLLAISTTAFSGVVKSYDAQNSCDLYKEVDNNITGKMPEVKDGETVAFPKRIYGMVFQNLEVDFDARRVSLDVNLSIVLGINQNLLKATIDSRNPNFKKLVNGLNIKVNSFKEVCVNSEKEIVYANPKEDK